MLCRFDALRDSKAEPSRLRGVFCIHVPKAAGTLRREGTQWHSEVTTGAMSFTDYAAAFTAGVGTQYGYFDDTGTGAASPKERLENVLNKVTFYGFSDKFDEFAVANRLPYWSSERRADP